MKRITFALSMIACFILATSCLKKLKKPEICIDGPAAVEAGSTHTYTYCGDAKDAVITWEYGQGEVEGESITITFDEDKNYELYLNQEVYVKALGIKRHAEEDGETFKVVVQNKQPTLCLKASDYFYAQGQTSVEGLAKASIKLYSSKECWEEASTTSTCLIAEATADADGLACFEGLEPNSVFIVEVQHENYYTNWSSNVRNMEVSDWSYLDDYYGGYYSSYTEENPRQVTAKPTPLHHLVTASKWKISDVKQNGSSIYGSISACSKDNYIIFHRDLTWELSEGADVCSSDQTSNGTFSWPGEQYDQQLQDYTISLATTSGNADFSSSYTSVEVNTNTMVFTSSDNMGNETKVYYSRVK